ncbi:hypothetical protein Q1W73_12780 [Asticcacaulis sp. ZE23SCel15]|uniref:hypothetical protein n=1 Tax=Asticcacaulis sp. ZE23SCel15 TaxID=3059027 RepID=UPI00265DC8E0|nr:hypothetical protein [Asticcacaulis sp. ZE23SCel15]WKL56555.1 hypothetical protein Q1W73_12780 [Asticcacaulis sp. ZE23SCel15]
MTIKSMVILLAYGALLQVGRLYVDNSLEAISAPSWTYNLTLVALAVLWLGGGNLAYYYVLKPREDAKRVTKEQGHSKSD